MPLPLKIQATQTGDMICQFRTTNILLAVRKVGGRYNIIGRAVGFVTPSPRSSFRVSAKARPNVFDVQSCSLTLFVDTPTLQLITIASLTPDQASRVPRLKEF
jgi:hypothetical protein